MNGQRNFTIRPTEIPELDEMLNGGLPGNAAILLAGPPGAGKSILALQWLFAGFRERQEVGIYFTLTEPTTKLLKNVSRLSFFDTNAVSSVDLRGGVFDEEIVKRPGLHFIDLRVIMRDIGIGKKDLTHKESAKVVDVITKAVESTGAKRIVIDSLTALTYRMPTDDMVRSLIFDLGTYLGTLDANVLMISEGDAPPGAPIGVEGFISDGVLRMSYERSGRELQRRLEIIKMRGIEYDTHATTFRIGPSGMVLYPRQKRVLDYPVSGRKIPSGVKGFDEMTNGGFLEGTTIAIMGPSGVGKSIFGLHFLYIGLQRGEQAVLVSFEESRDQIIQNFSTFGWDLGKYEKNGLLQFMCNDPEDHYLDEHISNIIDVVKKSGAKRVVIDSLSALATEFGQDGVRDFASRVTVAMKATGVTLLCTMATEGLTGAVALSESHLSSAIDNILVFRYVEIDSELRRALIILKMRGSGHDRKLRELIITAEGMSVSSDFRGYESVLSGSTRKVEASIEDQIRVLFLEVLGPMGEKIFVDEKKRGLTYERVRALIEQMGTQGVISVRKKDEFIARTNGIFNIHPPT